MSTPPYARLGVRVNGDPPQYGGITVAHGDSIEFVYESTAYWGTPAATITIYDYPDGWSGPGDPWVTVAIPQPNGLPDREVYVYTGNTPPPSFTLPALPYWGKFMPALVVNGGIKNGAASADLTDESTALQILSPYSLFVVAFREARQFGGWRSWAGVLTALVRAIDGAIASVALTLSNATPGAVAGSGASGSSGQVSRADHVHAHGSQTDPTMHALASGSAHGFFSSTLYSYLTGIQPIYTTTNITFAATSSSSITKTQASSGPGQELLLRGQQGEPGAPGGNLTLGVGRGGVVDTNPPGQLTISLESDGAASGNLIYTAGSLGTFLTVAYNSNTGILSFTTTKDVIANDAGNSHLFKIAGNEVARISTSAFNIAPTLAYSIDSANQLWLNAGLTTIGTDNDCTGIQLRTSDGTEIHLLANNEPMAQFAQNSNIFYAAYSIQAGSLESGVPVAYTYTVIPTVKTTNNTPTTLYAFAVPDNSNVTVTGTVNGRRTSNGDSSGFGLAATVKRFSGGSATQVGTSPTAIYTHRDDASHSATITVSGNNLIIQVTSGGSYDVQWDGNFKITVNQITI